MAGERSIEVVINDLIIRDLQNLIADQLHTLELLSASRKRDTLTCHAPDQEPAHAKPATATEPSSSKSSPENGNAASAPHAEAPATQPSHSKEETTWHAEK